jgi:ubiquinone/menaquinone biosynthesis C-methylase UbiE
MFKRLIAKQLKHPSGWIGRYVLTALWNRRNVALNDGTLIRLRLNANDQVLDVGFGGGYLIEKMLKRMTAGHVSGVDASAVMVEQCRRRFARQIETGDLDLRCATVDSLPYPHEYFRKVSSINSLFYWPDFRRGIREIRRVLATDGLLVLAYTGKPDVDKRGWSSLGIRSFADNEVARTLQEDGFRDVHVEQETDQYRNYFIITAKK